MGVAVNYFKTNCSLALCVSSIFLAAATRRSLVIENARGECCKRIKNKNKRITRNDDDHNNNSAAQVVICMGRRASKAKQGDLGAHALTTKARGDIVHHKSSGQRCDVGITHIFVREASGKRSRSGIALFAPRIKCWPSLFLHPLVTETACGRSALHALNASDRLCIIHYINNSLCVYGNDVWLSSTFPTWETRRAPTLLAVVWGLHFKISTQQRGQLIFIL